MLAAHAPGLSGLLLPGMAPIATQHPKQQQQEQATARQQTPMRQRPSTPSSPSLRGRQPQANPNFVPPASNISTRLPTPVRINASPGPSPTSVAPMLPKPPSPSRSISQGGAPPVNLFTCASACSSPAASTTISNAFMLPNPPSILTNAPPSRVTPVQPQQVAPRSALSPVPWASGPTQSNLTPTSVRPSPSVSERSILASVQLPNQQQHQQQRSAGAGANATGALASTAALPGHSEWLPPVAAPAPSVASPVLSTPAIQAALQQALQGAVERKPEAFRVDNFEHFFDSMMHPGHTGKLDGPLPHELADDIRYSDAWYKHCREWNARHKPITPYSAPGSAVCRTPSSCQFASTPFVGEQLVVAPQQQQQESESHGLEQQQQWRVGEAPMSDACCKALDIAHHGLSKVLTPTARSRSASDMTGAAEGSAMMHRQPFAQCTVAVADCDHKAPSGTQEVVHTAAALTNALETLAGDQIPLASTARDVAPGGDDPVSFPQRLAPALNLVASSTAAPQSAAAAHEANSSGPENSVPADADAVAMISGAPDRATVKVLDTALPPVRRKFAVPVLQLSILDAPMLPKASGATLSPAPDSARPPSTAATTPGPKTPTGGAAESTVTTAATTPVGRDAPTTPTTATARSNAAASPFFESTSQPMLPDQEPQATAAAIESLRMLSHDLAAAESVADRPSRAAQSQVQQSQPSSLAVDQIDPSAPTTGPATDLAGASTGTWSPGFPPPALVPSVTVPGTSTAPVGLGRVITIAQQRPPSPVTLLQNAPRDMPTPNPAFFNSSATVQGACPSSLAAAVTAVAVLAQSRATAEHNSAGPSTSMPSAPADSLKEIVVGIEKLSTLKQNILAEDKEVDVTSITQMIQLKLAVEQLLARTSSAVQDATSNLADPSTVEATPVAPPAAPLQTAVAAQIEQHGHAATPKKQSRTATFGAFLKSVFSPRSGSASKAQPTVAAAAPAAAPAPIVLGNLNTNTSSLSTAVPASPSTTAVGIRTSRPMSASTLSGKVPSPSLADRSRYAALHQRAAARLAEAAAEPAGTRPAQTAAAAAAGQGQRGGVWQRYEEKIALHRHQLDTTKAQLDEAVRKLNDMQAEFDELLLCLGMESAKNKALCDAMRAAGLDPEPILAAIEEQWMSGVYS
ncbi:hypothetical protein Vretimale_18879 [Volvox reticuliferus]|nr:hypothetical protein Vretifemale_18904 [Volvox reticuliferus]GIM16220.1 hypothetical protein Vretimale_18879 [Volvox reticuliferus]